MGLTTELERSMAGPEPFRPVDLAPLMPMALQQKLISAIIWRQERDLESAFVYLTDTIYGPQWDEPSILYDVPFTRNDAVVLPWVTCELVQMFDVLPILHRMCDLLSVGLQQGVSLGEVIVKGVKNATWRQS